MRAIWLYQPSGEMADSGEDAVYLKADLSGEMKPDDVPVSSGVDLAMLKAGDDDPLEVVVEIPSGRSRRDWHYQPAALQSIVKHVQTQTLAGFLGHQKAQDVDSEFKPPVTHWVGAAYKDGKAYVRGVIDSGAKDLKRWIRSKRVNQVSIFGVPKLLKTAGETQVVDYMPLSIDWTPLNRAGMPTRIVALGEMDQIVGGEESMDFSELVVQLKKMLNNREITMGQLAGEMGWTAHGLAGELDMKWLEAARGNEQLLQKVRDTLGVAGEMDVLARAKEAIVALEEKEKAEQAGLIDQVIKEKVSGEIAQTLIRRMITVQDSATKEQVAGEIDQLLKDPALHGALNKWLTDRPVYAGGGQGPTAAGGSLITKRVGI